MNHVLPQQHSPNTPQRRHGGTRRHQANTPHHTQRNTLRHNTFHAPQTKPVLPQHNSHNGTTPHHGAAGECATHLRRNTLPRNTIHTTRTETRSATTQFTHHITTPPGRTVAPSHHTRTETHCGTTQFTHQETKPVLPQRNSHHTTHQTGMPNQAAQSKPVVPQHNSHHSTPNTLCHNTFRCTPGTTPHATPHHACRNPLRRNTSRTPLPKPVVPQRNSCTTSHRDDTTRMAGYRRDTETRCAATHPIHTMPKHVVPQRNSAPRQRTTTHHNRPQNTRCVALQQDSINAVSNRLCHNRFRHATTAP